MQGRAKSGRVFAGVEVNYVTLEITCCGQFTGQFTCLRRKSGADSKTLYAMNVPVAFVVSGGLSGQWAFRIVPLGVRLFEFMI